MKSSMRKVGFAATVGTMIEWYDFFIYGTAAALVFNRIFVPQFDPLVGTMLAFGSSATGFLARPVGALVAGHYGDRVGRKALLTATLLIMGLSTLLIGMLPTYDQIGIWAKTEVKRTGMLRARSITQMLPSCLMTTRFPSGERLGSCPPVTFICAPTAPVCFPSRSNQTSW